MREPNHPVSNQHPDVNWRHRAGILLVVYRIFECADQISVNTSGTRYEFIEDDITRAYTEGFIDINPGNNRYIVTNKGKEFIKMLAELTMHVAHFRVFEFTDLNDGKFYLPNSEEEYDSLDIRRRIEPGLEDMRIPMFKWLCEVHGKNYSPHMMVFIHKLANDEFRSNEFFEIKLQIFNEIEEIVNTAYDWKNVCSEYANKVMSNIYSEGIKLLHEIEAEEEEEYDEDEECEVVEEIVEVTEYVDETEYGWSHDPGYYGVTYVQYDPVNVLVGTAAMVVICDALLF